MHYFFSPPARTQTRSSSPYLPQQFPNSQSQTVPRETLETGVSALPLGTVPAALPVVPARAGGCEPSASSCCTPTLPSQHQTSPFSSQQLEWAMSEGTGEIPGDWNELLGLVGNKPCRFWQVFTTITSPQF